MAASKCGTRFITMHKDENGKRFYRSFPLRCKSWNCPTCADNKSLLYGRFIAQWFVNKQLYFYTLTFAHSTDSLTAWKAAATAWNALNIQLHKKYGRFSYVKILESHINSNYPHYHILIDRLFSARTFGKMALAAGFGYQIRIQRVSSNGVNGYIRKYLGKAWPREDARQIRTTLHLRVFTRSLDLHSGNLAPSLWRAGRIVSCREQAIVYFLSILYAVTGEAFADNYKALHSPCPSFCMDIPPPRTVRVMPDNRFHGVRVLVSLENNDHVDYEPYSAEIDIAYLSRNIPRSHFNTVAA